MAESSVCFEKYDLIMDEEISIIDTKQEMKK